MTNDCSRALQSEPDGSNQMRKRRGAEHDPPNIRLRYAGLINFACQLFTIVTGFLFVITVTRNLTTADFGIWQNISDILGYALILAGAMPFSVTRYLSQGHRDAPRTGIAANLLISIPITAFFLFLSPRLASIIGADVLYFEAASLEISLLYLLQILQGTVLALSPHLLGYGAIVYEVTKIALGIVLVPILGLGLTGAILAVVASQAILSIFYLITTRDYLGEMISWGYIRSWWKASLINVYSTVGDRASTIGFIFLILTWGPIARAYVGAAVTVAVMIAYSNTLATALYPKLLAELDTSTVEAALRLSMLFAIPMTGGVIILSVPLLNILKPEYTMASTIVCVYAVSYLLDCFSSIMNTVIIATERDDLERNASLMALVRSKLFLLPTLTYIGAGIYLALLFVLLRGFAVDPLQAALYTSIAGILANIPIFLIRYRYARNSLRFRLPLANMGRYALATAFMMLIVSQIHLSARLSQVFVLVALGVAAYSVVVIAIDPEARTLTKTILTFVKKRLRR
jgi:O-antigen/teichoic acid export membrane protein